MKADLDHVSSEVFAEPSTDPYLVGIARSVEDGMAPGWHCLTAFALLSVNLFGNYIWGSCVSELC